MTDIRFEQIQREPVRTEDARLRILIDDNSPLPVGSYTFELTVVDDAGNASQPARLRVVVADTTAPTAVLTVLDAEGRPLPDNAVEFGRAFILSAERSADSGPGRIASFRWRLLDNA